MRVAWAALDVGGANLKLATLRTAICRPFKIWQHRDRLAEQLSDLLRGIDPFDHLAVTMTAEIADCFENKRAGVAFVCDAIQQVVGDRARFYQTTGKLVTAAAAKRDYLLTAASNWHATATFVGQHVDRCIVIDIGSTTTDVIPVVAGRVNAIGRTDLTRLQNGELMFQGTTRTPVCSVSNSVQVNRIATPLASEFFANMLDVYLLLGKVAEQDYCGHTADGRPATRNFAQQRLARMLCDDLVELEPSQLIDVAKQIARRQKETMATSIARVVERTGGGQFVVCGEGQWLAEEVLAQMGFQPDDVTPFSSLLEKPLGAHSPLAAHSFSQIGPAFSLAWLATNGIAKRID